MGLVPGPGGPGSGLDRAGLGFCGVISGVPGWAGDLGRPGGWGWAPGWGAWVPLGGEYSARGQ